MHNGHLLPTTRCNRRIALYHEQFLMFATYQKLLTLHITYTIIFAMPDKMTHNIS